MTPLLRLEGVSKRFGGLVAAGEVSLAVEAGSICSLIGPNGAGKTTLFNLISAVLRPTSGRILFEERDISRLPTHALARLGIARTFQNLAVFKRETVVENLLVGHARAFADRSDLRGRFLGPRPRRRNPRTRTDRGNHRVPRDRAPARPDCWNAVLRASEARRSRTGDGGLAEAVAAGRDGVRHEPGGARGHRAFRARPAGTNSASRSSWSSTTWGW